MRTKTNRLLMLLVGVAISGCASQTDRSSSGGGDQAQIEHERVGGSSNAVTQEELARRAAAKAAAEAAPVEAVPAPQAAPAYEPEKESVQYIDRPVDEAPPPKPAAVAAAPKDEALPDFPVTKYDLPEEQAKDEEVEELGPQDDDSVSADQDAVPEEESSVGETTEYDDDQQAEAEDSSEEEVEELGPQDDDSVSADQDAVPEEESSVGETTEYDDDQQAEAEDSSEVEDLGPVADDSGTVSYPEDQRAAAENSVGQPKVYVDEPEPPKPAPPKPAPAVQKIVSVNFETEPLFNFDKSEIRADQGAKLDEFISSLAGTQYDSIAVVGHADRIGKEAYNQKLSERRANAVKIYLISKGVPAAKIRTEGRGESEPVTGNTCAKTRGKALISCLQPDRRVDVSVSASKQSN